MEVKSISRCGELIEAVIDDIRGVVGSEKLYVAFSGGLDSSVTAVLSKMALGEDKVELVTTRFDFTYPKSVEIIDEFAAKFGLKHTFVDGADWQKRIWRSGPSCNACTRGPKLQSVKDYAHGLVATGAEAEDTWGQCGLKSYNGFYSPLFSLPREDVKRIAKCLGIEPKKIGENSGREGCMLKHLLKMMASPKFHGAAVYKANATLMRLIEESGLIFSIANVKIVGPLSKNIALVNLKPDPGEEFKNNIKETISSIEEIEFVEIVDKPVTLEVMASPGIYNNERSRYWVEKGRLAPDFAAPICVKWKLSKNNRLTTFQVVNYELKNS